MLALLLAFIIIAILIAVAWRAVRYALVLAKGDAETAFPQALMGFGLLSFVTGAMVLGAVYEHGAVRGLMGICEAIYAVFGGLGWLVFLMALAGQMIALVVLLRAWWKRRRK